MFELNRLQDRFIWDFGSPTGRWARAIREQDQPLIWLDSLSQQNGGYGHDLYCVNQTGETLDYLHVFSCVSTLVDESYFSQNTPVGSYENIKPDEAVKVAQFDGYYDLDHVLAVALQVSSPTLGQQFLVSKAVKGGISHDVLLWKNQLAK